MKNELYKNIKAYCLDIVLILSSLCVGLYYEWSACAVSVLLIFRLLEYRRCYGAIRMPGGGLLAAATCIPLMFLISVFWAADRGMSIFGFLKYLPLPLFLLCISQEEKDTQERLFNLIPWIGAGMVLISALLSLFPQLTDYFLVNHRLAGFFQYPNAFAAFLLCGISILMFRKNAAWPAVMQIDILFAGLLLSGSRTALVISLCIVVAGLLWGKMQKTRIMMSGSMILLATVFLTAAVLSGNLSSFGRILTTSAQSSTMLGRLLYWQDALPVIMRNPLGLGYLGYRFLQGTFQTGVYSVTHVHNELLQLMLDVGWIPAVMWGFVIIKTLLSRNCPPPRRALIISLCLHSLFDFDFQFPFLCFVLLLALKTESGERRLLPARSAALLAAICLGMPCLCFGVSSALYYAHHPKCALSIYPSYTLALLELMVQEDDPTRMEEYADRVLTLNNSVSVAHSAKALSALSRGEVGNMMEEKERAISLAPYSLEEYLDYFDMLSSCADLYLGSGARESASVCVSRMRAIPEMLAAVEDKTSTLGRQIQDKPNLRLPESYRLRLERYVHSDLLQSSAQIP